LEASVAEMQARLKRIGEKPHCQAFDDSLWRQPETTCAQKEFEPLSHQQQKGERSVSQQEEILNCGLVQRGLRRGRRRRPQQRGRCWSCGGRGHRARGCVRRGGVPSRTRTAADEREVPRGYKGDAEVCAVDIESEVAEETFVKTYCGMVRDLRASFNEVGAMLRSGFLKTKLQKELQASLDRVRQSLVEATHGRVDWYLDPKVPVVRCMHVRR